MKKMFLLLFLCAFCLLGNKLFAQGTMVTNNTSQDMQVWSYCVDKNACVGGTETYYWVPAGNPSPVYIPACPSGDVEGFIIEYRDYVQGGSPGCSYELSYVLIFDNIMCNSGATYPGFWNPTVPYFGMQKNCTDPSLPVNYTLTYSPGTLNIDP